MQTPKRSSLLQSSIVSAVLACVLVVSAACSSTTELTSPGSSDSSTGAQMTGDRSDRGAEVSAPTLSGPITGGQMGVPFLRMSPELAEEHGYVEEEFFMSGEAVAYEPAAGTELTTDGKWSVDETTSAPYVTRMLVRRPVDPAEFNGTVFVEWLNVSGGMDADADFGFIHDELLDSGTAYVGVSAQLVGIEGGMSIPLPGEFEPVSLKEWDPERYGDLTHPGDEYSYDIYSQAAQALLRPGALDPLGGLAAQHLIAAGESQSGGRMATYVNAIHPIADIYDGFLVHSRGNGGANLNNDPAVVNPPYAWIRDDLQDPVFQFESETDLYSLNFVLARQPDTDMIRTWEVAGTAHFEQSAMDYMFTTMGEYVLGPDVDPDSLDMDFASVCGPLNAGPHGPTLRKAVADLRTWIIDGTPPATAEPIETADGAVVRDEHGNALGGVRTPPVDVPIATLSGDNSSGGGAICMLFGNTTPLDSSVLAELYPTHDDYVAAVTEAGEKAEAGGYVLASDAAIFVEDAQNAAVPG